VTGTNVFTDPDGRRWALRCTCGTHPDRGHAANPLPPLESQLSPEDREATVVDTIEALGRARAVVDLDDEHHLVLDSRRPLDPEVAEMVGRHWLELAWAIVGRDTGHEWLACDRCGEPQLVEPDKAGRQCHLTFGCKGHLRRPERRLLDPRIAEAWRHRGGAA
jgi:hypothetical protein